MADTLGTLSAEAKQFYRTDLLYRARQAQIFYPRAQLTDVAQRSGNSVSWRRFEALGLATTALTEGVAPAETPLSLTEVTGTVAQYGNFIGITDAVDTMAIDQVMSETTAVLAQNGGESIEAVIVNTIDTGTNIIYATGSTRGAQGTGNPLTVNLFRRALTNLDVNKTHRFGGQPEQDRMGQGAYVAFVHPYCIYDLNNDQELKNAMQYNATKELWDNAVMQLYGIQIYQSTLCPIFAGQGSGGANVYGTIIMGLHAWGAVDVAGKGKYEMEIKDFGSAGTRDPLSQLATVGWKSYQLPVILNNNFMVRIESGATYG